MISKTNECTLYVIYVILIKLKKSLRKENIMQESSDSGIEWLIFIFFKHDELKL